MKVKAIALHTLEFLIVVGLALVIKKTFQLTSPTEEVLIAAVLAAFAKTVRELNHDFVNK